MTKGLRVNVGRAFYLSGEACGNPPEEAKARARADAVRPHNNINLVQLVNDVFNTPFDTARSV